jgi:uncharacterized protein (TIGR03089 family)
MLMDLLRRRVADDPGRPLLTFYDDARGERVELSARTFDNWVAKTANLLVDGLGAQPGDRVAMLLPPHWQTAAWLMACWAAGLAVRPAEPAAEPSGDGGAYFLAASEEVLPGVLDTWGADAEEIVGLSLHALGGPLRDCPPGVLDYAVEVRGYGDRFTGPPIDPAAPALEATPVIFTTLSAAELAGQARAAAEKWRLDARSRVLTDVPFTTLDGLLIGLLAPLAAGASVIIQRNLDETALDRRIISEHVTAVAGVPEWKTPSRSVQRLL